ncbi:MAG: methylase, partial [Anaerolineae bacterium]|nr:methylase [Anaerolineae bacterium]
DPVTALESAARLRRLNPQLPVLGVEIDPERVAVAQPFADALTAFRLGGFNLPLKPGESVRCIRAFNVLRQYEESEVAGAYDLLARSLLPGGLLVEGTSEPFGRLWVANVVRRGEGTEGNEGKQGKLAHEALVFSTNFRLGFDPADFQAVLPKNLIHRVVPGEQINDFFATWKRAALETSAMQVWGTRQWFRAAALRLAELGYSVVTRPRLLNAGLLVVPTSGAANQPILRVD